MKYFEAETVITGALTERDRSYHASLQDVIRQELSHSNSIRRKYGDSGHLMTLPSGDQL